MTALTSPAGADTEPAGQAGLELSLSIWDALMLGRVSATRSGLRAVASCGPLNPTTSTANRTEVA